MKTKELYPSSKLTKNMKVIWRSYRMLIKNKFEERLKKSSEDFNLFISIEPYYAIMLMSRIRKLLFKIVSGNGTVEIKPYIRPKEDKQLGILIKYEM